jgi:LAO/AO transport system kinase
LVEGVVSGDRRAVSRAITLVESGGEGSEALLTALVPHSGRAHVIGVTGASGTGKSTLIAALARAYRDRGARVAIVAVDPTSSRSGGALLGDRIRMRDLADDPGVTIRSMASRGASGGVAQATADAVTIFDAAGNDVIFAETVGAGQDQVTVAQIAHTTLVVEAPGLGDEIQAIKAGLLEIADVVVVNKVDRQGADQTVRTMQMAIALGNRTWTPPLCETIALDGTGTNEVIAAIDAHRQGLAQGLGEEQRQEQARARLERAIEGALLSRFVAGLPSGALERVISRLAAHEIGLPEALAELGL